MKTDPLGKSSQCPWSPRRLSHMIPSSMAGQISFDSSNVVELVCDSFLFSPSPSHSPALSPSPYPAPTPAPSAPSGEGNVREDHYKDRGGGQLVLLCVCHLHLGLQQEDGEEEDQVPEHPPRHACHLHGTCHTQVTHPPQPLTPAPPVPDSFAPDPPAPSPAPWPPFPLPGSVRAPAPTTSVSSQLAWERNCCCRLNQTVTASVAGWGERGGWHCHP